MTKRRTSPLSPLRLAMQGSLTFFRHQCWHPLRFRRLQFQTGHPGCFGEHRLQPHERPAHLGTAWIIQVAADTSACLRPGASSTGTSGRSAQNILHAPSPGTARRMVFEKVCRLAGRSGSNGRFWKWLTSSRRRRNTKHSTLGLHSSFA